MKKRMFLIVLVFFITIIILENNSISMKKVLNDQNLNSKTKENSEIYTSNNSKNTEEIKIQNSNENLVQTSFPEIEVIKEENKNFFNIPENTSEENIKAIEEEINKLPLNIVKTFNNENWKINISNEDIASKYFKGIYSNVIGVTITNQREIIIQNKKKSIQSATIHEIGHYIDWHFKFPSLSNEFHQIYNEEINEFKSKITNSSAIRDEKEFFAHTFYYYIKEPAKCTSKALQFVQDYVSKI